MGEGDRTDLTERYGNRCPDKLPLMYREVAEDDAVMEDASEEEEEE